MNPDAIDRVLETNLADVRRRVADALARAGRPPASARVVVVTKQRPVGIVRRLIDLGVRALGENRVQEAEPKIAAARAPAPPPPPLEWHLIGHLQANKARRAVALFDWIHSVDDADLLDRIDRIAGELGRSPRVLLQLNVSGEATKSGAATDAAREELFARAAKTEHARVVGLMTMAPLDAEPETARPWFRMLREIRDREARRFGADFRELSMGMSNDFEVALEEGATLVRIGSAFFRGVPDPDPETGTEP